ncbi:hypothetical protein PR202_ga14530 [Eleusine coracana subsp. coracana]|uniref:Uncharacterized protein n=1 Tax=Eleusine coracana subsp. coracana TaxID=191504 RepID=A0AAV5CHR9_ELECO|nr:hypothetical protein PR202_ga14530 [Eleusine coracana subsp. coracana]
MASRAIGVIRSLDELQRIERARATRQILRVDGFRLRDAEAMLAILHRHSKSRLRWIILSWDSTSAQLASAAKLFLNLEGLSLQIDLVRLDVEERTSVGVPRLNQLLQAASDLTLCEFPVPPPSPTATKGRSCRRHEAHAGVHRGYGCGNQSAGPWSGLGRPTFLAKVRGLAPCPCWILRPGEQSCCASLSLYWGRLTTWRRGRYPSQPDVTDEIGFRAFG